MRLLLWLLCAAAALPAAALAPAERFFDYLYIEASSGSSAGGHAAVRFDDEVFHFQHGDPGIIRTAVQSWASFDLSYRGLGNRPIHVQRVRVSAEAYERLRDAFHQRHLIQESHVRLLEDAQRDTELLECLAAEDGVGGELFAGTPPRCAVDLAGAGYFFATDAAHDSRDVAPAAPIAELRQDLERTHGATYFNDRRRETRARIEALRPELTDPQLPRVGRYAAPGASFAAAYSGLLREWLALGVLDGDALPLSRAFRKLPGNLTAADRRALAARERHQRRIVGELLSSTRDDRGYPLLIALARLVALRASLESDRLVVLDTYGADEKALPPAWVDEQRSTLLRISEQRRRQLEAARRNALSSPADDEASWSRLEVAANVGLELDAALNRGRTLRWERPLPAPARGARLRTDWPRPALGIPEARAAADHAAEAVSRIGARLRELYRYDLLQRNCVTEIFRTIDAADGAQEDLGGRVVLGLNATFIPFVSADAVRGAYVVSEENVLPSYRQQGLERLRGASGSWTEVLREETTLTATLVPFNAEEEVFLFFSEDSVALRPLAGVANAAFAAAGMVGGLLISPIDGGVLLGAGARGLVYSFPEIAFVNIRKGTVPLLPPNWDGPPPFSKGEDR